MDENTTVQARTVYIGELLADYICGLNYGTIIHYQDIEKVIGLKYKDRRYYAAIAKARNILREKGKEIKSIGKNGDYQVLYPGDYAGAYVREVRVANNHIKRGKKILNGAPVSDMTIEERTEFRNVSDFHTRLEASICGQFVEVKRLTDKKHPLQAALEK